MLLLKNLKNCHRNQEYLLIFTLFIYYLFMMSDVIRHMYQTFI